jgi:protein required for attachment to host cells
MNHTITWVATFNGAEFRAYAWDRAADRLSPIELSVAPAQRKAEFTDRPVRTYSSASSARGAGDPRTDAERTLEEEFVISITGVLAAQAAQGAFHRLVIAAPPRALGVFRAHAPSTLSQTIQTEIGHDYVNTPQDALRARLHEHVVP